MNVRSIALPVALGGGALVVFGLSGGYSAFGASGYHDKERMEMALGAALAVGGTIVYLKGWPPK